MKKKETRRSRGYFIFIFIKTNVRMFDWKGKESSAAKVGIKAIESHGQHHSCNWLFSYSTTQKAKRWPSKMNKVQTFLRRPSQSICFNVSSSVFLLDIFFFSSYWLESCWWLPAPGPVPLSASDRLGTAATEAVSLNQTHPCDHSLWKLNFKKLFKKY